MKENLKDGKLTISCLDEHKFWHLKAKMLNIAQLVINFLVLYLNFYI